MIARHLTDTVEEIANVATHGLGLIASLAVFPAVVLVAMRWGDPGVVVGAAVFGASLIGVYASSTMYHALPTGPRKDLWRSLDQCAVYLLIAGTYTPFALGALRGPWGWALLGTIWLAALTGIIVKIGLRRHADRVENAAYLAMGWFVLVAAGPLLEQIGWAGLAWLLAGGVAYTVGTIFLVRQSRLRFGHCAWHVFVLGGSACHVVAVLNYGLAIPG